MVADDLVFFGTEGQVVQGDARNIGIKSMGWPELQPKAIP
jgi:hypothetical protein